MSVKIGNGFIVDDDYDVFEFVDVFKSVMPDAALDVFNSGVLTGGLICLADRWFYGKDEYYGITYSEMFLDRNHRMNSDTVLDINNVKEFSISLGFDVEAGLVGVVNVNNVEAHNLFLELMPVKEFGYWNGTDHHPGVSDEEWDFRRSVWDRVLLEKSGVPAVEMLSSQLFTKFDSRFKAENVDKEITFSILNSEAAKATIFDEITRSCSGWAVNKYYIDKGKKDEDLFNATIGSIMGATKSVKFHFDLMKFMDKLPEITVDMYLLKEDLPNVDDFIELLKEEAYGVMVNSEFL